jgi:site-specific recombinase XerD
MILANACEQYAAFRRTLSERFEVNGRQIKAFCRFMGPDTTIADVASDKVNMFLAGRGPLTASWHVRHNALRGFYRYAVSRGLVLTSPLPVAIPKRPSAFQPHIYSQAELRRLLNSIESCRRRRSDIGSLLLRCLFLLMYGTAMRISEALSLTIGTVDLANGVLTIRDSEKANFRQPAPRDLRCRMHAGDPWLSTPAKQSDLKCLTEDQLARFLY